MSKEYTALSLALDGSAAAETELSSPPNVNSSNGEMGVPQTGAPNSSTVHRGSSVGGAIFNFANCIIGAGAIGLGGAFALSGGLISVASIIFFGVLTKLSLDLVIEMSLGEVGCSYEDLGKAAYGQGGWIAVLVSKFLYSFGCLVAYIVVVKDNFGFALLHLLYGSNPSDDETSWSARLLARNDVVTLLLSAFVILPLCLLRDMSSLSNLSAVSVASMMFIVLIVIYLYVDNPNGSIRQPGGSLYENWFEIRPGYLESLGTYVFTFVSQHTVHLTYESMHRGVRNFDNWKVVSTCAIAIATGVSLTVGVTVYCTFWEKAGSDLFEIYPPLRAIDLAKILLCFTMLMTFPLPFFTCRELVIVSMTHSFQHEVPAPSDHATTNPVGNDRHEMLQQPLLTDQHEQTLATGDSPTTAQGIASSSRLNRLLMDGDDKQLKLGYHVVVTVSLWSLTTLLAILAPSLGDVLDLVGCATGTVIAFILPGLFSFRLQGYTHLAALILTVGGIVGLVGTAFSFRKLVADM